MKRLDERILERFGDRCTGPNGESFLGFLCYPGTASGFPNGGIQQSDLMTLVCKKTDYNPNVGDVVTIDGESFKVVTSGGALYRKVSPAGVLVYVFVKEVPRV